MILATEHFNADDNPIVSMMRKKTMKTIIRLEHDQEEERVLQILGLLTIVVHKKGKK